MARDSFLFKKSWMLAIDGYASNVRCEFYEAVLTYLSCGRTVDLVSGGAKRAFSSVKKNIDAMDEANELKSAYITAVRRIAGKKGGKANGSKQKQTEANSVLLDFSPSSSRTRIGDNNKINNQDLEDNNQEKIERESQKRKTEKSDSAQTYPNGEGGASSESVNVRAFIEYFNETLCKAKAVIPHSCTYTEKRDAAIHARVREHGRKSLQVMVQKAAQSDFLNGMNSRTFVASLDWLLRPNNFVKVIEGNYDNQIINNYGKTQQSDPRRGFAAQKHSAEEY